jgi:hypothetical protein
MESNPELYKKVYPIHIEMDESDFALIRIEALKMNVQPFELAKSIIIFYINKLQKIK